MTFLDQIKDALQKELEQQSEGDELEYFDRLVLKSQPNWFLQGCVDADKLAVAVVKALAPDDFVPSYTEKRLIREAREAGEMRALGCASTWQRIKWAITNDLRWSLGND